MRAKDPIFPLTCEGIGGRSKEDVTDMRRWLEREKRYVTRANDVADAMDATARKVPRNSALEWLAALPPSPGGAISQLAALVTKDEMAQRLIRMWLIGCAARLHKPGCEFHTMLVLCAKDGGEHKSRFFRVLGGGAPDGARIPYRSHLPDMKIRARWRKRSSDTSSSSSANCTT